MMKIVFIETKQFRRKLRKVWNEKAFSDLKDDLTDNPDLGDVLRGGDGIRKLRRRAEGRGKSAGVRIIYYWQGTRDIILMLDIYAKSEKSDLTDRELQQLVKIKRELLG